MNLSERDLFGAIGKIYDAPGNPAGWDAVTAGLTQLFVAEHCHLVVMVGSGEILTDFVTTRAAGEEYAQYYGQLDTAVHRVLTGPDGRACTQNDVLSIEELRRCPVQQELLPKYGVAGRLWTKDRLPGGLLYIGGIMRPARSGEVTSEERRALELLHPHLKSALRLHLELEAARSTNTSLEMGLDALRSGVILLDRLGTVVYANRVARAVLDARQELRLERGRLVAGTATNATLDAALYRSLGRNRPAMQANVAIQRNNGGPLLLRFHPLNRQIGLPAPRAVVAVLFQDPSQPAPGDMDALLALGLTRAEAGVVAALMTGESLEGYAARVGLRVSSVRSTLKTVFAKMGTHRQSELVASLQRIVSLP